MAKAEKSRSGFVLKASLGILALAAIAGAIWAGGRTADTSYTTFTVRRGPLDIKVVEGGEIKAMESQEIKSQIKGYEGSKILFIVEEGIYVTDEDVKNKKKLVELDSSSIKEKLTTAEISFKGTQASLIEAEKAFEIEVNQAESDIYTARLDVTFAEMGLAKYLGTELTGVVMKALEELRKEEEAKAAEKAKLAEAARKEREELVKAAQEAAAKVAQAAAAKVAADAEAAATREAVPATAVPLVVEAAPASTVAIAAAPPAPAENEPRDITLEDLRIPIPDIDFSGYARDKGKLGNGEASQKLSTLRDAVMMARAAESKAQNDYKSQKTLFDKKFITPSELENFQINLDKCIAGVTAAETAEQLFITFEFKKEAQKLMSDYVLATRKLQRTEQQALSKLAQGRAKLLSAQGLFKIESERIKDYEDQIAKCVMVAERAGLVVYGGGGERYWNQEPIKEGTTVREKQAIITIPDMSKMSVKVNIHESDIKKIAAGLKARVRVDAFPDRELDGEVTKVGVLPDSENRWMNPDLKVYETTIKIEGTHDWLKPGMSAQAEVLVTRLDDAVYIPIQSVVPQGDKQVCFVIEGDTPQRREVETGEITVEYIVVTKGLKTGERVLIRPPDGSREEQMKKENEEGGEGKKKANDKKEAPKPAAPGPATSAKPSAAPKPSA